MLLSLRAAALSLAGSLALVAPAIAGEGWIADFDEAVKIAKAEKKDLFVDFTGSDWCGWCKKLDSEVFSHQEFLDAAKKSFVLVALDFPKAESVKAKVPNPKRNQELSDKYEVQGFPTLLLMTADGEVFGQMGYMPGGPSAFVPAMNELVTSGKQALSEAKQLVDAFGKAEGEAKLAAWDKLAEALETAKADSVAGKLYVAPVRTALEFDKDNAKGRKLRAVKVLLKSGNGDEATFAAGRELDPKNAAGLLELCLKAQFESVRDDDGAKAALDAFDALTTAGPVQDKEINFFLHITATYWCSQFLNDVPRAKKYAARAKEIGSDNADALEFIEKVLSS